MTWRKRIGLIVGLIFVLALSAGLTMYVNNNNGKITGMSASLMATDYPVGTDYSGTITKQYVKVGDAVKPGQPLFEIESPILARDLAQGLVTKDSLSHELKGNNTLVITATNSGQVDSVAFTAGAFVPANSTIATVQQVGTMYVSADFVLTAKDYARLPTNATMDVLLPTTPPSSPRSASSRSRPRTAKPGPRSRPTARIWPKAPECSRSAPLSGRRCT